MVHIPPASTSIGGPPSCLPGSVDSSLVVVPVVHPLFSRLAASDFIWRILVFDSGILLTLHRIYTTQATDPEVTFEYMVRGVPGVAPDPMLMDTLV